MLPISLTCSSFLCVVVRCWKAFDSRTIREKRSQSIKTGALDPAVIANLLRKKGESKGCYVERETTKRDSKDCFQCLDGNRALEKFNKNSADEVKITCICVPAAGAEMMEK